MNTVLGGLGGYQKARPLASQSLVRGCGKSFPAYIDITTNYVVTL